MARGMARMVPVALVVMALAATVLAVPVVMDPVDSVDPVVPVRPAVRALPRRRQRVWRHRHLPAWPRRRQSQTVQSRPHPLLLRSGRQLPHQLGRLIRRPDAVHLTTAT